MVYYCYVVGVIFFFKQKTAYEMRISDWSSDVCSSDLVFGVEIQHGPVPAQAVQADLALRALGGECGNGLAHGYWLHATSLLGSRAATTRRPSDIRML